MLVDNPALVGPRHAIIYQTSSSHFRLSTASLTHHASRERSAGLAGGDDRGSEAGEIEIEQGLTSH